MRYVVESPSVTGPGLRGAQERLEDVHHVLHTWALRVAEYFFSFVRQSGASPEYLSPSADFSAHNWSNRGEITDFIVRQNSFDLKINVFSEPSIGYFACGRA